MENQVYNVFYTHKPVIAMLHLNGRTPEKVHELARCEIEQLYHNGADAVLVEDYFGTPEDVEWALDYLKRNYSEKVYGVNLLSNPEKGLRLAKRYDATFVQIDSICGHLPAGKDINKNDKLTLLEMSFDEDFSEKLNELRQEYPVFLLGGVRFKYQPILSGRSIEEDLSLGKARCDAIVVTGTGTGIKTDIEKIKLFRKNIDDYPLFVGAGMTEETVREQLGIADGAIVGSWFKQEGKTNNPVDPIRVRKFMEIVKNMRN